MLKIIAVGDIMPGGVLSITNKEYATQSVRDYLSEGDIRVGTFECAIEVPNPRGKKYDDGGNTIFIKEKDACRVKDLGIDIVSIANNHLFDLGPEGAFKTMDVLDRLGIKHCGAGRNLAEAQKPVVIERDGETYAFLAFGDTRSIYMYEATETEPGVNPLHEEYVIREIRRVSQEYDYVIAIPHWGIENTYFPPLEVERLGKEMLKAGACLVLGGHSHRIQPVLNINHKSIVYSMGNFLFSNRIMNKPRYTWYPDKEIDIWSLPQTMELPVVEEPTLKLTRPLACIGMVVKCTINKGAKTCYKLTYTDRHNQVDLMRKGRTRQRIIIQLIGISIKMGIYKVAYYCWRLSVRLNRLLKKSVTI